MITIFFCNNHRVADATITGSSPDQHATTLGRHRHDNSPITAFAVLFYHKFIPIPRPTRCIDFSNLAREKCIFHIGSYKWVRINPYLTLVRLLFKSYSTCRSIPLLACGVNRSPAVAHMAGKIRDHSRQMGHVLDSIISQWPPKSPPTRRMTPRSWSLAIALATDLRDIPRISAILWVVILLFSWMSSTILCELVCELVCEPLGVVFSVDLSSLFGFGLL